MSLTNAAAVKAVNDITEVICNRFKDRTDHAILVEDISSMTNVVYSRKAWDNTKRATGAIGQRASLT